MKHKRTFVILAVLLAVCVSAYAVNIQGLLMKTGIEWSGDTLRVFNPIDLDNGWKIDGVTVTTTAAEINAYPGTGLSAAELLVLKTVTPGTSAANKAVVLGATSKINTIDLTAVKLNGTSMTATAAELNVLASAGIDATEIGYLNAVTAGTRALGKAIVVNGAGTINALDVTALSLGTAAVTATAAELNAVTGNVTAVQAQANALKMVRTFTETAAAGTYTATVAIPAGYTVLNISVTSSAVWNNTTSATLDVGDDDDPEGYFATVDLKTVPAAAGTISTLPNVTAGDYGVYCGVPKAYAGAKTITATVVTVHAVGDTGRSTLIVEMVKTANAVAAASKV